MSQKFIIFAVLAAASFLFFLNSAAAENPASPGNDYQSAKWDPIHFPPAIDTASNEDCLRCHNEVLEPSVREKSPAGVPATDALAWYQTLDTYEGPQETFHRRHMVTPLAQRLMQMKCITCHQGNEPRDEMGSTPPTENGNNTLRKMVDPNICLMCHGQMPYQNMGLPMPWNEIRSAFGNTCLTCHAAIRTNRHQVNFLKPEEIEKAGKENADYCYGCHGGRVWYHTSYPYPRHPWAGMAAEIPEWAKGRQAESPERFRIKQQDGQAEDR